MTPSCHTATTMNNASSGVKNTKKCPHCAEEINVEAKKCKHCGEFLEGHSKNAPSTSGTELRKMSYWKGLATCIGGGIGMIVIGILCSMIIIGMIIGIPLILAGIVVIIGSPVIALYILEGKCPFCQNAVIVTPGKKMLKCRSCKQRSSIREMHLVPVPVAVRK